jgi:hypothetical protein
VTLELHINPNSLLAALRLKGITSQKKKHPPIIRSLANPEARTPNWLIMVQLKLGLGDLAEDSSIDSVLLERLREFSSDQKIAIIATDPKGGDPGVTFVTFEFGVAGDEVYQVVGDQCVAWLDEAGSSGVMVYTMIRDKPFE